MKLATSGAGIAMREGDTALRGSVNDGVRWLQAAGAYERLQKKYVEFDISGQVPCCTAGYPQSLAGGVERGRRDAGSGQYRHEPVRGTPSRS